MCPFKSGPLRNEFPSITENICWNILSFHWLFFVYLHLCLPTSNIVQAIYLIFCQFTGQSDLLNCKLRMNILASYIPSPVFGTHSYPIHVEQITLWEKNRCIIKTCRYIPSLGKSFLLKAQSSFLLWRSPQESWWEMPLPLTLEKEMATHSSILAQRILQTEESGGLQSRGSQRDMTACTLRLQVWLTADSAFI